MLKNILKDKQLKTKLLGAGLLVFGISACGRINEGSGRAEMLSGIVGGRPVLPSEDYSQKIVGLKLIFPDGAEASCTGSILNDDTILTAAHCLDGMQAIEVRFGPSFFAPTFVRSETTFKMHDSYLENSENEFDTYDVGLVHFEGGLPEGYVSNQILNANALIQDGQNVILSGYGVTNGWLGTGSGTLRVAETVPVKNSKYAQTEIELNQSKREGGHGGCYGDSGGPAFIRINGQLLLWGVTSRGENGCDKTSIYTDLRTHSEWIRTTSESLRALQLN